MRFVLFALLFVVPASASGLFAQAPKAQPCALLFEGIDPEAVIATCTQLIESGKLKGKNLARAYLTRILARGVKGMRDIDHSRMIAETTVIIENDPEERLAYLFRLDSYLETGDYDRALEDANKYVELGAGHWNALNVRSSVYVAKGDYERALADDTKAVEMAPKEPVAYAARATTYLKAGRPAEALLDINTALSLPFPYPFLYYQRGEILERMGRTDEAIADYRTAHRLEPNHVSYREALKRLGAVP